MEDTRRIKEIYPWTPHSRRRRGRPQQSWKNQVMEFMRSRNMEEDMTVDRHLWHLGVDGMVLGCIDPNNKKNKILSKI